MPRGQNELYFIFISVRLNFIYFAFSVNGRVFVLRSEFFFFLSINQQGLVHIFLHLCRILIWRAYYTAHSKRVKLYGNT